MASRIAGVSNCFDACELSVRVMRKRFEPALAGEFAHYMLNVFQRRVTGAEWLTAATPSELLESSEDVRVQNRVQYTPKRPKWSLRERARRQ